LGSPQSIPTNLMTRAPRKIHKSGDLRSEFFRKELYLNNNAISQLH
jgi:hypothetical protein